MKIIFVVDDNNTNLMTAKAALDGTYRTFALPSAEKMFALAEKFKPDLILLDVDMPEMDGFQAMEILKADENLKSVPVIFLTLKNDETTETRGFEMGAVDFINKPFSTPVLLKRIELHIETDKLIKDGQKELRKIHNATIDVIANMVDRRDKVTGGHSRRVQTYMKILIDELVRTGTYADEISQWDIELVRSSGQLHDVGKICISDEILQKPSKLTAEEFDLIKKHCDEGVSIIDEIIRKSGDDGFLRHAKKFACSHHEKWNGTGYPRGLAGEEIPPQGRIMAVADVYDVLVSQRPYKNIFSHEQATEIIKNDSGTHFDPKIVEAFLNVADDFLVESKKNRGQM
ncbi:MAG: response regulator [Defluviitaleaceae bacterium]|nr:response regulator [Defluviitaleaceae bacterium]